MLLIISGFAVGYQTAKLVAKHGSWAAATSATIAKVKSIVASVAPKS